MGSVARSSSANLDWLDEELRKQKAKVAQLQDLVDKQQVSLVDQAHRTLALEDRLAKMQAAIVRIPEVEEGMQHTRDEVALALSEVRESQQRSQSEFLRNRQAEREQDVRSIQEVKLATEQFGPIEKELAVRRAEDQRLNESLLRTAQELEALRKQIAEGTNYQRQLADTLQKAIVEARRADEAIVANQKALLEQQARLLVHEDGLVKHDQRLGELDTVRRELTEQQAEFLESQRRAERARAQSLTEWGRQLADYQHQVETWGETLRHFSDQHERNRRVLRETQELSQDISQRQDQLRTSLRVAEEQLRRELREFRSENDKLWAKETERHERLGQEQTRLDAGQDTRLAAIEEWRETTEKRLAAQLEALETFRVQVASESRETRLAGQRAWEQLGQSLQSVVANMRELWQEE
jgi:chromosome segregation ATPase